MQINNILLYIFFPLQSRFFLLIVTTGRDRTKSGKSEASQEAEGKSAPGSATSSKAVANEKTGTAVQSLDVITWPLEEDEEEKLVDGSYKI